MGQGAESCGGYDLEHDEYEENLCSGRWVQRDGSSIEVSKMGTSILKTRCAWFAVWLRNQALPARRISGKRGLIYSKRS